MLGLAVSRTAYFIAREDGPLGFMVKLRMKAGTKFNDLGMEYAENNFAEGLLCTYCNSFWISIVVVVCYSYFSKLVMLLSIVLALSMIAVMLTKLLDE